MIDDRPFFVKFVKYVLRELAFQISSSPTSLNSLITFDTSIFIDFKDLDPPQLVERNFLKDDINWINFFLESKRGGSKKSSLLESSSSLYGGSKVLGKFVDM